MKREVRMDLAMLEWRSKIGKKFIKISIDRFGCQADGHWRGIRLLRFSPKLVNGDGIEGSHGMMCFSLPVVLSLER
jgi:hypothetical protein